MRILLICLLILVVYFASSFTNRKQHLKPLLTFLSRLRSMRSGVSETVERPSVRLYVPSFHRSSGVRRVCCWAPNNSNGAAARGCSTALSSKCGQCHVDSQDDETEHRLVAAILALEFLTKNSVENGILQARTIVFFISLTSNCSFICFVTTAVNC